MRGALLALTLLSAGCHPAVNQGPPEPQVQTTVKVENRNFLDMNVCVLQGGTQRIRLGTVTGLSSQIFTIPAHIVRSSPLQFELHPIGGRRDTRTETISVQAGDQVELTIPPL